MSRTLQRIIEWLLTAILLIPALVISAIAAIVIMLVDGHSPFFHQERIGKNGSTFPCFKLQTMRPKQDGEHYHNPDDDARRVTPLGACLRAHAIDELPQFINILRGEMRLFGPRPLAVETIHEIRESCTDDLAIFTQWSARRQTLSPGLCGWWQVHTSDNRSLHYDNEYYDGLTLRQFCKMVGLSFKILPSGKSSLHACSEPSSPLPTDLSP